MKIKKPQTFMLMLENLCGGGVIFLTNNINSLALYEWINKRGIPIVICSEKIHAVQVEMADPKLIVSYNYRHMIDQNVIDMMNERVINLHTSLLPWNRGASPNIWSFLDNTPKGVTIHVVDKGLDTGDIIYQKKICFNENKESFRSSYNKLHLEIQKLFRDNWKELWDGTYPRIKQAGEGSYHVTKDLLSLTEGNAINYDLPIYSEKKHILKSNGSE